MKKLLTVLFVLFAFNLSFAQPQSTIQIHRHHSKVFQNDRLLRVYLPPGYDDNTIYQTLYLNDGQNAFGGENIKPSADWRVDEILDSLIAAGSIEPIVVVAIDNIGISKRGNEYLPWPDIYLDPPISNPQGALYPVFLKQEIIPFIEANYSVSTKSAKRTFAGFSYGGLMATYAALTSPNLLGNLLIESPSYYVNEQAILDMAREHRDKWPHKIYVGIGTNELALDNCDEHNADNRMAVNDVRKFTEIIEVASGKTEVNLHVAPCAHHTFKQASERLPTALLFLFPSK